MHIYFSGIGGTGLGPLALIAQQAGYTVSGSDKQDSQYITYLRKKGIMDITIDQSHDAIAARHAETPIDWFVYTTAVTSEQADAPELAFCREHGIRMSLRDELLNQILADKHLKLLAIAGTHGKTTTTAMAIWLMKQMNIPVSYSVGAKIPFGDMGHYESGSEFFVYEADEYARNFLSFHPELSVIVGIDYDHPDIYPTREAYEAAFQTFVLQSTHTICWDEEAAKLPQLDADSMTVLQKDAEIINKLRIVGSVNRWNAYQVIVAVHRLTGHDKGALMEHMNAFPGLSRRFEQLVPGLITDYAHTPPKIRGALDTAKEVAGDNVVVVYEGLHNTRQHFIKDELSTLFDDVKHLYVVPSYLAREDPNLPVLSPVDLINLLSDKVREKATASELSDTLQRTITSHLADADLVLCLTAGGGHSLDEWLRTTFPPSIN